MLPYRTPVWSHNHFNWIVMLWQLPANPCSTLKWLWCGPNCLESVWQKVQVESWEFYVLLLFLLKHMCQSMSEVEMASSMDLCKQDFFHICFCNTDSDKTSGGGRVQQIFKPTIKCVQFICWHYLTCYGSAHAIVAFPFAMFWTTCIISSVLSVLGSSVSADVSSLSLWYQPPVLLWQWWFVSLLPDTQCSLFSQKEPWPHVLSRLSGMIFYCLCNHDH